MDRGKYLTGIVVSGLGEGALFMSLQHYRKEIRKKLGFRAYPGTLNLRVGKKQARLLNNISPIKIKGFRWRNKKFGSVNCYRASIKNIKGSVIMPEMTKLSNDIIEFIAPVHLKSELKIKEGARIKIDLQ